MISYVDDLDIFSVKADAIVNPCNCVGVAGAGLSLEFRKKCINNFNAYHIACMNGQITIGKAYIYFDDNINKYIVNLPTKDHWKDPSTLSYIELGLIDLKSKLLDINNVIHSIAIPKIGCGLGGLDWTEVKSLIESILSDIPDTINIMIPSN